MAGSPHVGASQLAQGLLFATLKSRINGVYHHVGKQHLRRYLSKFHFRYNSRKEKDGDRTLLALGATAGTICYADHIEGLGRELFTRPDGSAHVRASVWIEQEIAIATYIQRVEKRSLPVIAFVHKSVGREGYY
jgi:hypothetical protein